MSSQDATLLLNPVKTSFGDPVSAYSNTITFFPIKVNDVTIKIFLAKKSDIRVLKKELDSIRSSLPEQINSIDYAHICSKMLKSLNFKLKSNSAVEQKRFYSLLKEKHYTNDPEKVVFNFSKYVLSNCEKSLLTKSLNFSIP